MHDIAAYRRYLASPAWAARRTALFRASDRPRCHCCGRSHSVRRPLDAHHLTYANVGNEQPGDLVLVCRICHDMIHNGAMKVCADLWAATELVRSHRRARSIPPEWRGHAIKAKKAAIRWRQERFRKRA